MPAKRRNSSVSRHYIRHPNNISGQRFGRLVVVDPDPDKPGFCRCLCDCGHRVSVRRNSLISGNTKSCGCLRADKSHINGLDTLQKNAEPLRTENQKHCTNFGIITKAEPGRNNKSGMKGVWYNPVRNNWFAYISVHRRRHCLGVFKTFAEAADARLRAEERYFKPLIQVFTLEMKEEGSK